MKASCAKRQRAAPSLSELSSMAERKSDAKRKRCDLFVEPCGFHESEVITLGVKMSDSGREWVAR